MEETQNVLMNLLQNLPNACGWVYLFQSSPVVESWERDQLANFPGSVQNENIGPLSSNSRKQVLVKVLKIKLLSPVVLPPLSQPKLYIFKIYYLMSCPLSVGISRGLVQTFTGPWGPYLCD